MTQPRIFVSSVMIDFVEYRDAARAGIEQIGAIPVLVEDFPSFAVSPRTACLDGVASCDALIVIVGSRGGWVSPSGKLVIEEEVDEARRRKIPILVFLQTIPVHDEQAHALIAKLSDYVDGQFRTTFDSPQDLQILVAQSLLQIVQQKNMSRIDPMTIINLLLAPPKIDGVVDMRFVIAPERKDVLIDQIEIASPRFIGELQALAHKSEIQLLSYEQSKKVVADISDISIVQMGNTPRRDIRDDVIISVQTTGAIIVDANVTARRHYDGLVGMHFLLADDIVSRLTACFAFVDGLYHLRDPYRRFDRFSYNVALHNVRDRVLVDQMPAGNSYTLASSITGAVPAFDEPQILSRDDLSDAASQIDAALSLFRRRIKPRSSYR